VKDEPDGQALWVGSPRGEDAREAVRAGAFNALMGPRFSPDGALLAFTAQGPGPLGGEPPSPWSPLAWLSVPVAEAHGEPWNIWTVRPDGTELRRLGSLQEDEPLVAWSPDGRWLAVLGTGGLWLLDPLGTVEPTRVADGSFGAIDWTR
jgi:Tol biopolymer transport system component